MGIDVKIDLSDLQRAAQRAPSVLGAAAARVVKAACEEGAAEARRVHAYKDRTGNLTKSIHGELTFATRGEAEGEITAGGRKAPYAVFVEEGTKPHEIRPKLGRLEEGPLAPGQSRGRANAGKSMLAWQGPGGDWRFAKRVKHQGTSPHPFMGPALLKAERVAERELDVIVAEELEKL